MEQSEWWSQCMPCEVSWDARCAATVALDQQASASSAVLGLYATAAGGRALATPHLHGSNPERVSASARGAFLSRTSHQGVIMLHLGSTLSKLGEVAALNNLSRVHAEL